VHDLGSCDWADVNPLAEWPMNLKARCALPVWSRGAHGLYSVACVGADVDALPYDVVGSLAVRADAERVLKRLASLRAEEDLVSRLMILVSEGLGKWGYEANPT
jgi:hypothetical protein